MNEKKKRTALEISDEIGVHGTSFNQSPVRPKTSQIVIDEFTKLIDSQDTKGFAKYGKSIDAAIDEDYNWELMALEETADLQKYLVRRIIELNKQIHLLTLENQYLTQRLMKARQ